MSRIYHWTLTALALAFLLGLAREAAAKSPQPAEARRQIALGWYRAAELTANEALRQSSGEATPSSVRQEWLLLLAEVYYRSRQYDQALDRLWKARQLLDRQRQLHPGYEDAFTKPRLEMALWQARIALAQAAVATKATAPQPPSGLVNEDIPAEGLSLPAQADRLELLVLRAQLGDLREVHSSPPDRQRRWSPLRLQAETLLQQAQTRLGLAETEASILLSLARCCEAEGNPKQAADILRAVALPPHGTIVNPRIKELRAEAARILRRAKLFPEEARFWQDVLDTARFQTVESDRRLVAIERLNIVAGIHFDRAETLHLAGTAADTVKKELRTSEKGYHQALELVKTLPANLTQTAELGAIKTVSLQGLLRIRLTPEDWNNSLECSLDENDVDRAVSLHDLLKATRIEGDPLVHHLEATLGAQYLRRELIYEAKESLVAAHKFFETYRLAPPATQVQLLVLLAEIDRYEGCYSGAQSKLEEAANRYGKAGLQDENLRCWIEVHRGRLAAACGRFVEAEFRYGKVIRGTEAAGSEAADAGSMARLGLAMLYKGFGRLDKAEEKCREAIAHRKAQTPAAIDDSTLVPYQVALAGILILEGNKTSLDAAEIEVNAAQRLLKNPVDRGNPPGCELLHLAAMLKFLRYKSSPCEDLTADKIADSAEKSWRELLGVQKKNGERLGEARTRLYLSQLYFLRWQRQALYNATNDLKKYEQSLTEYGHRLDALNAAELRYNEDYNDWKRKTIAEQRSSFGDLNKRWADLKQKRAKLAETAGDLRRRKEAVLAKYDAVRSDMLPTAARPGAVGSASSASTEVEPEAIATADVLASQAVEILEKSPMYPNLQYITLCHRASVLRARAEWNPEQNGKALACLKQAVALLEHPRLSLSEGDVARAEFLSQYTQAFDQLIEWNRLQGKPLEALVYAELCRSRTFLDWIRSNGDDTQRLATDQKLFLAAEEAFKDSTRLARELERMDVEAAKAGRPPNPDARKKKLDKFNRSKQQYEERQEQILEKNRPGQAGFGKILRFEAVQAILQGILHQNELAIYYHVGSSNSYLFLLGLDSGVEVIRLRSGQLRTDLTQHISAKQVKAWVEKYLDLLSLRGAFPHASTSERTNLASITDQLLPPEVRGKLAKEMQRRKLPLIVSPDGSLQQLPFDALWVQDGDRRAFLIDCLPPTGITYTPSLMILDTLEQVTPQQRGVPSVVTVACAKFSGQRMTSGAIPTVSFPDLPGATKESQAVASAFAEARVCTLLDDQATEDHFRRAIVETKPACVHLATHCDASALVFHPGVDATRALDDGRLTIGKIYALPLASCRLAVLSACRTNEGPEVPREMAMSISRAFLVAGARRVVASQWKVEDEAGCAHVGSFLAEVARRWKAGQSCNYAAAMIDARQKLRTHGPADRTDDPYLWAPFVLIGPACDVPQGSK